MQSKRQRQLPLEVSTWMNKDLTIKKISANSRLLTSDTRQNIILGRHFFSDLLTLSFARYRTIGEYDCNKRLFLRNQQKKTEKTMPGLRSYVDQLTNGTIRPTTARIQANRNGDNPFLCSSTQSFLSHPATKSDPMFNRREQPLTRQIRTAEMRKSRPAVVATLTTTTPTAEQLPTVRKISRDRINRLALPKGYRFKSAPIDHSRSNINEGVETVEEVLAQLDQASEVAPAPIQDVLPEKPKGPANDQRFHQLMSAFSRIHVPEKSNTHTFKSIIQANTSLQVNEGQRMMARPSVSSQKVELKHSRQTLAKKRRTNAGVFLIDVGA